MTETPDHDCEKCARGNTVQWPGTLEWHRMEVALELHRLGWLILEQWHIPQLAEWLNNLLTRRRK